MARAYAWLSSAIEGFGANVVRGGYHAKQQRRTVELISIFCGARRSALPHQRSECPSQFIIAPAMANN